MHKSKCTDTDTTASLSPCESEAAFYFDAVTQNLFAQKYQSREECEEGDRI